MAQETAKFFTPTYAKVCVNKSNEVISIYLSNSTSTNVQVKSKKVNGEMTLQVEARAKTSESTSLNNFIGLDDPSLPVVIDYCLEQELFKDKDISLLESVGLIEE